MVQLHKVSEPVNHQELCTRYSASLISVDPVVLASHATSIVELAFTVTFKLFIVGVVVSTTKVPDA